MRKQTLLHLAVVPSLLAGLSLCSGRAGTFNTDFSSPPAGASLYGDQGDANAGVIEDGVLKLTKAVGSQQGGFIIDDLDGGATVTGFTATFKLLIGGGSGADGFSFNFASDLPDGAMGEEGAGTGLTVSFDTYDNGGGEAPAIDVKKGGVVIASTKGIGGVFRNNTFQPVRINVDIDGSLDLSVGTTVVYTNLLGAFTPTAGRFGFGARTGGAYDNHWVDDLSITTRLDTPTGPVALSAAPQGGGISPDAKVVIQLKDGSTQVSQPSVKLKFNGADVTAAVSKAGDVTTVEYDPPGLLPPLSTNSVELAYTDTSSPPKADSLAYTFVVANYVSLPPSTKVTPDTSKRGFVWRMFANSANQTTSNARAEAALNGELVDATGAPLPNLADYFNQGVAIAPASAPVPDNAPIKFEIDTVINVSPNAGNYGTFQPDDYMPGLPASDGSNNGVAAEIITYVELPAGATTMGVASDDGFKTMGGAIQDAFSAIKLGEYDGGRGVAETLFTFVVEEAGVYPFRTVWEQGGGDANLEWYTLKADGTRVLLNDTANGGLKAYRVSTSPIAPYAKSVSPDPVPRQANLVSSSLSIVLADGNPNKLDDTSITLKVDGQAVTPSKTRNGSEVKIVYTPDGLQIPSESHTADLTYKDTAGNAYNSKWAFRNLKNIVVPAASATENFDSMPDGTTPPNWNAWNFTSHCNDSTDPTDQTSTVYENWAVTTTDNVMNVDGDRVFNVAPGQSINGVPIDTPEKLFSGNVLYAESDSRCNTDALGRGYSGQAQFIVSKAFDLSSLTKGVVMTLSSIYEQNQDSYGGIEYSVDGGQTFLPVAYFLDSPDIVLNADGTVDAVKTFTNANTDTAAWVDNGEAKGGKYGDGVGAPITAALGDYIVPRVNDDRVEGKRVEVFRLPQATGKSDVRLRLSALGTDSWYFAIDNIAFYNVEPPAGGEPPKFNAPVLAAGSVQISWTGTGTLEEATAVTGPYTASASQANPQTVTASGPAKFYRLKQ